MSSIVGSPDMSGGVLRWGPNLPKGAEQAPKEGC